MYTHHRIGVIAAIAAMALSAPPASPAAAGGQERVGLGFAQLADGNCSIDQRTVTGEYERTSDALQVHGRVRTEPAGGDCRLGAFSYDVGVERYFSLGWADATVVFSAREETTAAPYVLAGENGAILLRDDGGALYGSQLPAGTSQTIVAAVGASRAIAGTRLGAYINLAPIDWAGHRSGRTVRLSWDTSWRGLYGRVAADVGADHFGQASAGYRHQLADSPFDLGVDVTHAWGLAAVDNGAPLEQLVAGSTFLRDGPPQDSSTLLSLTVGYRLGD